MLQTVGECLIYVLGALEKNL